VIQNTTRFFFFFFERYVFLVFVFFAAAALGRKQKNRAARATQRQLAETRFAGLRLLGSSSLAHTHALPMAKVVESRNSIDRL
jgi:hypothetical protein